MKIIKKAVVKTSMITFSPMAFLFFLSAPLTINKARTVKKTSGKKDKMPPTRKASSQKLCECPNSSTPQPNGFL